MASKRRVRRKACTGKHRYQFQEDAERARGQMAFLHRARFNAYHCRFCGGWHVGHTPSRVRRAIDQRGA